jgi:hypothetical protein
MYRALVQLARSSDTDCARVWGRKHGAKFPVAPYHNLWRDALVLGFVLAGMGCQKCDVVGGHPVRQQLAGEMDKRTVLAYLAAVQAGCPVARIEVDLGLSPSTDRWAPTFQPYNPFWRVRYWQHGLLIAFDAKDISPKGDGSELVYAGNPGVMTDQEYQEELRTLGLPPSTRDAPKRTTGATSSAANSQRL